MLPERWNITHHIACSFVSLGVPYELVCSNSSESNERKRKKQKRLLCCSVPGKASFPLDLCVHPCPWSFLHARRSFFCVFPCVWRFPLPWQEASLLWLPLASACVTRRTLHAVLRALAHKQPWTLPWIRPCSHLYSQKLPFTQLFLKLLLGSIIFEPLVPDKLCLQGTIASRVKGNKWVDSVIAQSFFPWGTTKNQVGKLAEVQILTRIMSMTEGNNELQLDF